MIKKASLLCFTLVLAVSLSGCCGGGECSEEVCKEEFDLIKCTREECAERHGPIVPPTGPDIVLGPGDGTKLIWEINQGEATELGSVFDTDPAKNCKLREDFIGDTRDWMNYVRKNHESSDRPAKGIRIVSGGIELKIEYGSGGGLDWWIKNKTTGESCKLEEAKKPDTITDVPTELYNLTYDQPNDVFEEFYDKEAAKSFKFRVKY